MKAGKQFIVKDSGKISKYHGFNDGDIVTMDNDIPEDYLDLDLNQLKAQAFSFTRDTDELKQGLFLRDVQPVDQSGGADREE